MRAREERLLADDLLRPVEADASLDASRPLEQLHPARADQVELSRRGTRVVEGRPSGEAPIVPIDPELVGRLRHRV